MDLLVILTKWAVRWETHKSTPDRLTYIKINIKTTF